MAKAVAEAAQNVEGKKAIAVESFGKALQQLPTILADNAGLDSSDLVTRLRKAVYSGLTSSGLDLLSPSGGIADMRELGVIESYKLKRAVHSMMWNDQHESVMAQTKCISRNEIHAVKDIQCVSTSDVCILKDTGTRLPW